MTPIFEIDKVFINYSEVIYFHFGVKQGQTKLKL